MVYSLLSSGSRTTAGRFFRKPRARPCLLVLGLALEGERGLQGSGDLEGTELPGAPLDWLHTGAHRCQKGTQWFHTGAHRRAHVKNRRTVA